MIWRDDDVLWEAHGLDELLLVDDLLQERGVRHTVAIIADRLTPAVAAVIRERQMVAQLHCWHHDDLSVDVGAIAELPQAVQKIEELCGQRPTVLYPPWNRTSPWLEQAASELNLRVSAQKISLEQFIRFRGHVSEQTINFHYWHEPDRLALGEALRFTRPDPARVSA